MLTINQLRINNLLRGIHDSKIYVVKSIIKDSVVAEIDGELEVINLSKLAPVRITDLLLKEFQFVELKPHIFRHVNSELNYSFDISFVGGGYNTAIAILKKSFHYIHQVQNLYYALTEHDLERSGKP